MKPIVPLLIGAAALLALGAGGGGGGPQGEVAPPQRTPSTPPAKPPTPKGEERNNDEGRTWETFYANRDAAKHFEMKIFSVASSPSNAAIGSGQVVVDVYETIVANADWQWQGQSCLSTTWILTFSAGHLVKSQLYAIGGKPCQSVRPIWEVYGRKLSWIQIGSNVLLVIDTKSGLNRRSPDKMIEKLQTFSDKTSSDFRPGKYSGTGRYSGDGTFNDDYPQWDNDNVSSGYVTFDASWIFNKA